MSWRHCGARAPATGIKSGGSCFKDGDRQRGTEQAGVGEADRCDGNDAAVIRQGAGQALPLGGHGLGRGRLRGSTEASTINSSLSSLLAQFSQLSWHSSRTPARTASPPRQTPGSRHRGDWQQWPKEGTIGPAIGMSCLPFAGMLGMPVLDDLKRFGPDRTRSALTPRGSRLLPRLAATHYENFSVVTWLTPRPLRPAFQSIYAYCRWSDDLGDEVGDPARAGELLAWWRGELRAMYDGAGAAPGHDRPGRDRRRVRDPDRAVRALDLGLRAGSGSHRVRDLRAVARLLHPLGQPVGHWCSTWRGRTTTRTPGSPT